MFELSLKNFRNYVNLKGAQLIELKNGYKSLIDTLIKPHEKEFYSKLNLNHDLTAILLSKSLETTQTNEQCEHSRYTQDKNKIVLKLRDKSKGNSEVIVICDRVICTVSLGVLKANLVKIIQPASLIPEEKLAAVSRVGFGTLNKVIREEKSKYMRANQLIISQISDILVL